MRTLIGALCWHAAYTLNLRIGPSPEAVATIARMAANPRNRTVLVEGCASFRDALRDPRRRADPEAILKALGDAAIHNVDDPYIYLACAGTISGNVVFNLNDTKMLHEVSPRLTESLVKFLRKWFDEPQVLSQSLEHVAGFHSMPSTPLYTRRVQDLGGFALLREAVDKYADDGAVQMSAWRGFSDHAHTELGAKLIANLGGNLTGIDWLLGKLRDHPEPHYGVSADTLDCHYEVLQVVNGLVQEHNSNAYGPALLKAGVLGLARRAMEADPDLRGTQEISCDILAKLMSKNEEAKAAVAAGPHAFVGLIAGAMERFQGDDPTPWAGGTFGQAYPVLGACARALSEVASDGTGMQAVKSSTVSKVLASARPGLRPDIKASMDHLASMLAGH